jgi:DNA-binding PadR family transcriptional regulator
LHSHAPRSTPEIEIKHDHPPNTVKKPCVLLHLQVKVPPSPILHRMPIAQSLRSLMPLGIGLLVGAAGATLWIQSMPGAEGSPEARANKLELELKRAQNRITALEASDPRARRKPGKTFADTARNLAEDIREGKAVSPDDIFRASQPLLRDLAPLFDRMRVKQQQLTTERLTGELTRKYNLTPKQSEALAQWFTQKSADDAKRWNDLISKDGTRLEDIMRASRDVRPDDGLDPFMEKILSGDKLTAFKTERMAERAERVQQDADTRVQRLTSIVQLDDAQRGQVFGIMARSSRDYDPSMQLEGVGNAIVGTTGGDRQQAMLAVLRPDQRAAYEAEQQRRRDEASKDMEAMGLTLPANWDMLQND